MVLISMSSGLCSRPPGLSVFGRTTHLCMCSKKPCPKTQETPVLVHLPQFIILTSLGLVILKCQIRREHVYLLPYKFNGRIKRKSTDCWINVLTSCRPMRGEVKTHYFPKTPHSWSEGAKLSCVGWRVGWRVASAGVTHQASQGVPGAL